MAAGVRTLDVLTSMLRKSARLYVKATALSFGNVAYLDNVDRVGGSDTTVIMLHGLGANKDTWLSFARHLDRTYRLVIPDLPGHGESVQDCSLDYGLAAQARRLLEFIRSLGVEKAHFIGNSMGGGVIVRLANLEPDTVLSMALIDSYGAVTTPARVDELARELGYNPMLEIRDKKGYRMMMSLAMFKPPFIPGFMVRALAQDMRDRSALNKKILRACESEADLSSLLSQITCPALIIWGADDNVLHPDSAEVFERKLPDCSKVILEETGHIPMVERPRTTAAHYSCFLRDALVAR